MPVRVTAATWKFRRSTNAFYDNAFYDVERFGPRFVASPRYADVLLVTEPLAKNLREVLEPRYAATPNPKWVVVAGDCATD